ncbi:MAG: MiaB/RimO family radical SAM methylthiotransferase [Roseburia sp.]|nr:MiaB/RimO family radical SAM methylthiotransferase [Roseburia sp.]MCM1097900.1 MiaB/RimO family radical SAM methylthiotransferase [Ruminococcus flavefaciens]
MKSVALHNLGCKVNFYEMEVMQQKLLEKGYEIVAFDQKADIYIINTCTVTNIADRKSRQMLHRARQLNPEAVVVAVGCYVQTGREALEKDAGADLIIGNNRKKDIVTLLEEYLARREEEGLRGEEELREEEGLRGKEELREEEKIRGKEELPEKERRLQKRGALWEAVVPDINRTYEYEEMRLKESAEHTRVYIKIQDGCNQFCSYCAIPYARGRVRSRRAEDILEEIRGVTERGFREVVLTGIHISSYGIDLEEEGWRQGRSVPVYRGGRRDYGGAAKLIDLVERLHGIPGLERIRLGSLEPRIITSEAAERLAALPKVCPHFHLSLQSGCDATLRRMNRHYTAGEYYTSVQHLRKAFQEPAITTDVIVGFPGETEEEFAATKEFLEKVGFYEMHIFKYSKRQGTAAAGMANQVSEKEKAVRSRELSEMEKRQSAAFRSRYIGRVAEVLLEDTEEIDGQVWRTGHTKDYVRVAVRAAEAPSANEIVKIPVSGFLTEEILR